MHDVSKRCISSPKIENAGMCAFWHNIMNISVTWTHLNSKTAGAVHMTNKNYYEHMHDTCTIIPPKMVSFGPVLTAGCTSTFDGGAFSVSL